MKRVLKVVGAVVLVVVLAVAAVLAVTFMGRQPIVDGQEFSGMRIIEDGFTAVGVIPINDRQVALIDTGQDAGGDVIKRELARRKLQPDAVAAILVTHGHPDHIGAINQFPQARVMALEADVPLVEGRAGAKGPVPRLFPVSATGVTVDQVLHDGEVVMLDSLPVRVYAVPGHTAGSAAYFVNGALFIGDSADVASDGRLQGSPWIFSDSQADNRSSLVSLEQRLVSDGANVRVIIPSHSGTASGLAPLTAYARGNE
jgi:glyoxylase-like metal-dependent hydrolase (beta-lactamase superfamily II)